ncbi:MAG: hypothetical protein DI529_13445 [Chryseobacterium sp.]|nr:MAG: hypothetical protein DI529_13445 [Chryseobacterium sp.]
MKNILLIIFFSFFGTIKSQSIHDKIFKDIIRIDNSDIISNGKDYMLRFPINAKKGTLTILNNDPNLPAKIFFSKESFLEKQNKIILITPDWEYLKSIWESDKRTGRHSDPVNQRKFYQIDRIRNTVDSITIVEEYLKTPNTYNFSQGYPKDLSPIYAEECNENIKFKDNLLNVAKKFEIENNTILVGIEKHNLSNKKNNYCNILTFHNHNYDYEQRVTFINFLRYLYDKKNKKTDHYPKLFLPIKLYNKNQ